MVAGWRPRKLVDGSPLEKRSTRYIGPHSISASCQESPSFLILRLRISALYHLQKALLRRYHSRKFVEADML